MKAVSTNWAKELESRRGFILTLFLLVIIFTLAVSSLRDSYSFDAFWHLKMGQDWVEKGLSPFQDHYSIVFFGADIKSPAYLFQLVLYGFVALLGQSAGFKALVFFSGLLSLGLMMAWLKLIRAPVVAVCLAVSLLVLFLQQRAMVRPELFSYALMILSFILYEKARTGNANRIFPFIALTMLFWTNYHSAILGYVIFFGLFVDLGLRHAHDRAPLHTWSAWAGWGLLIVLVGMMNPAMSHPLIGQLNFSNEWKEIIREYRSPFAGEVSPITIGYIILATTTLLLSLKQKLFGYAVVNAVFIWSAVSMERMITPAGIAAVCMFALAVSSLDSDFSKSRGFPAARNVLLISLVVLLSATFTLNITTARKLIYANQYLIGKFPDRLVQYMLDTGKSGNIFNNDAIGGYLIYHLGDSSRVYIDSRTNILYPFDFNQQWRNAVQDPALLRSEILEHDIDYVILGHRQEQVDLVHLTGLMQLDYSDLRFSLYVRENANFPVSGDLWSSPWCWGEETVTQLPAEYEKANQILPEYSPLSNLVRLAFRYSTAQDRRGFISAVSGNAQRDLYENSTRFAGYRALESGMNDQAITLFSSLQDVVLKDYLALALAHIRAENVDRGELIISEAVHIQWRLPVYNDFRLIQGLLTELENARPLKTVEKKYYDELSSTIGENAIPVADKPVSVADFCTE
jgi:hypothetical protein